MITICHFEHHPFDAHIVQGFSVHDERFHCKSKSIQRVDMVPDFHQIVLSTENRENDQIHVTAFFLF